MFSRKSAALLFVTMLMCSSQLPSDANDFQKVLNAGKKAALKQVGRTLQKKAVNAASSQKASITTAKAATTGSGTITKGAATSATASSKKSTTAKIQEKIAAEAARNAKKYGNKYLQKGERQLTKLLK